MKEYLSDLLTEFDEMGYCPTTLCLDGEEQAIAWKKEIVEEINKLKRRAEVAELALELLERGESHIVAKNIISRKPKWKSRRSKRMTKQEQIKEMAKVIATTKICDALALSECIKKKCDKKREYGCSAYSQAEALYDAGYRKQSDTVKEFAKRAKSRTTYHPQEVSEIIDKIAKEITEEE